MNRRQLLTGGAALAIAPAVPQEMLFGGPIGAGFSTAYPQGVPPINLYAVRTLSEARRLAKFQMLREGDRLVVHESAPDWDGVVDVGWAGA